jgi:hypothetical protein
MGEAGRKSEVLRALGKLAQGLSALFWGLPLAMLLYVQTARSDWMESVGVTSSLPYAASANRLLAGLHWLEELGVFASLPSLAASFLLVYGIMQMEQFQRQERIWRAALDRALFLGWANAGLTPFLFWWHRLPFVPLFSGGVSFLAVGSLLFLGSLNNLLRRLTAMLPDEMLRHETRLFAGLNRTLLAVVAMALLAYLVLSPLRGLPRPLPQILGWMDAFGLWAMLFFILMPLAMTMSLIWKIKAAILASVFEAEH